MKPISIQIVPAQPGFLTVIDFEEEKEVEAVDPVIAWRIETYSINDTDDVFSTCIPLTIDGDPVSNCIGVKHPDNMVTIFQDSTYKSMEELQEKRYPLN